MPLAVMRSRECLAALFARKSFARRRCGGGWRGTVCRRSTAWSSSGNDARRLMMHFVRWKSHLVRRRWIIKRRRIVEVFLNCMRRRLLWVSRVSMSDLRWSWDESRLLGGVIEVEPTLVGHRMRGILLHLLVHSWN